MTKRPTAPRVALLVLAAGAALVVQPLAAAGLDRETRQTLFDWLECTACDGGELAAVLELGEAVRPALEEAAELGPPAAARAVFRWHLQTSYDEIAAYAAGHPGTEVELSREEYVATYEAAYADRYTARAKRALAKLDGAK